METRAKEQGAKLSEVSTEACERMKTKGFFE